MPGGGTDVRILIAEDEKRASRGLRNLIMMVSDKHEIVGEAADGKEERMSLYVSLVTLKETNLHPEVENFFQELLN